MAYKADDLTFIITQKGNCNYSANGTPHSVHALTQGTEDFYSQSGQLFSIIVQDSFQG